MIKYFPITQAQFNQIAHLEQQAKQAQQLRDVTLLAVANGIKDAPKDGAVSGVENKDGMYSILIQVPEKLKATK